MINKNKVAIFIPSLRGGGAERAMVTIANGMVARNIMVDLVLVDAIGVYLQDVSPKVRIINLRSSRVLYSLFGLIAYLRRERPAALLSALNYANIIAILAKIISMTSTRLVISERSNLLSSQRHFINSRQRLTPLLMRYLYPVADRVVAISEGVADDLVKGIGLCRSRISVIYNPAATNNISDLSQELVDCSWFNESEPPVIIAAGRLSHEKGFDTLLHAFTVVRAKRHVRLVILGEGQLRATLEKLSVELGIVKDFALPGFVSNPYAWMSKAEVFVLSSLYEGFGNVLVEAMASGVRVVSTNCPGGPSEILQNGRWGRLVSVGDVAGLATAIEASLDDVNPPDVKHRALAFTPDRAIDSYLKELGIGQPS